MIGKVTFKFVQVFIHRFVASFYYINHIWIAFSSFNCMLYLNNQDARSMIFKTLLYSK
uniref:Uncharacterized protein n=1 Tax=Kalanchoe fedtschenkoi TaxID=63787 RepID=A0A7N0T6S9_KALFE